VRKTTITRLDEVDLRILQLVQDQGRVAIAELAKTVSLSPSTCARRLRLLEDGGVILGYGARIDHAVVGLPMVAFVLVSMSRKSEEVLSAFEAAIGKAPEVMEAYLMTGRDDYLLRVVVSDLQAYERFVKQRLTRIPGVAQVETSFMLRQVTARSALPIPPLESQT
jgi:Lrp/AsnC family transcriptional regulator, leucine-responsive regulatory protein